MSFTDVFGGDNIDPSYLSYAGYTISSSLVLEWPLEPTAGASVMAAKMDVTATTTSLSLSFPDATMVSVGRDALVRNAGSNTFTVKDSAGNTLGTVASGQAWYFYLIDNATAAGTWESVQFGSGTSSASAASLAGAGLEAVSTLLNQDLATTTDTGDHPLTAADRATVVLNAGGSVTYVLTSAATLGNGWFVWVINGGSGNVVLTPGGGQTIDGEATKTLAPTESVVVFSNGSNFWTAAYGRSVVATTTATAVAVTGEPSPLTLTPTQVAAQVQDYSGTLGSDLIVNYGVNVGFWFVYNNTTAAHSLTLRVDGSDPGVAVTQGTYTIVRSNGANMEIAFTATTGTVSSVATTAELTGGPITTTGTLDLSNTGATPGTYGSATRSVTGTVTNKGRLTALSDQLIQIPIAQIDPFSSADLRGRLTDETGAGLVVFNDTPTLTTPIITTPAVTGGTFSSPAMSGTPTAPTPAAGDNSTTVPTTAFVAAAVALLNSSLKDYLAGLTLSTAGASSTFGVAAGVAADTTSTIVMQLASAYTKTTGAWAVGTGNGSLDTGSVANTTWYHAYLIRRPDTGVVDVLTSLSATAPTLPTNYTQYRRIGAMQTDGSAKWVKFKQLGDDFYRLETLDYTLGGGTAAATLMALSVPTGVVVEPFTTVVAKAINNNSAIIQYAPASDATLLFTVGNHYEGNAATASSSSNSVIGPPTNTSAQIYIAQPSAGGDSQLIYTYGWRDTRGRDA